MDDISTDDVVSAFQRLNTGKACGIDRLPAEFITKAFSPATQHAGLEVFHFAPVLASMFSTILRTKNMPMQWKAKCIHPVHKRGSIREVTNYRPIGVSTTMYILFTNILAARIMTFTAPSHDQNILLDTQFAFRRELSVEHAHTPIVTAIGVAKCMKTPLVMLKLDIEKAYDTVHRDTLW